MTTEDNKAAMRRYQVGVTHASSRSPLWPPREVLKMPVHALRVICEPSRGCNPSTDQTNAHS